MGEKTEHRLQNCDTVGCCGAGVRGRDGAADPPLPIPKALGCNSWVCRRHTARCIPSKQLQHPGRPSETLGLQVLMVKGNVAMATTADSSMLRRSVNRRIPPPPKKNNISKQVMEWKWSASAKRVAAEAVTGLPPVCFRHTKRWRRQGERRRRGPTWLQALSHSSDRESGLFFTAAAFVLFFGSLAGLAEPSDEVSCLLKNSHRAKCLSLKQVCASQWGCDFLEKKKRRSQAEMDAINQRANKRRRAAGLHSPRRVHLQNNRPVPETHSSYFKKNRRTLHAACASVILINYR